MVWELMEGWAWVDVEIVGVRGAHVVEVGYCGQYEYINVCAREGDLCQSERDGWQSM